MTLSMRAAPHHDLSDAALAEYAGAGDESAFEALDRRHRSTLQRHCNGILRNGHDAEEAVQGVLLKAYRALSSGQRPASLLPWLIVIARNECFDIMRAGDGCRSAAERTRGPRRSALGALFPFPLLAAVRSLFFGGGASGAMGGVGSVAVVGVPIVAAVTLGVGVLVNTGGPMHDHAPSVPAQATSTSATAVPTPATLTPPTSVSRTRRRSPSGGLSPPETVAGGGSSTPSTPVSEAGAAESAADHAIPSSRLTLTTPSVRLSGTGITVPSVELPPALTIPARAPSVRLSATGVTVPSVELPTASIQTPAVRVPVAEVTCGGRQLTPPRASTHWRGRIRRGSPA